MNGSARVGVNMADNVRKFINTCAAKATPFSPFVALVWSDFFLGKDNFGVDELCAELHFVALGERLSCTDKNVQ